MSDSSGSDPVQNVESGPAPEHINEPPEVLDGAETGDQTEDSRPNESIDEPAKVMRVGAMMRQLLEELRNADLDEPARDRMRRIYEISVRELGTALSPDLRDELGRLALPFSEAEIPSEAELRVAEAQLVGWLEGLIQGIQASLFAQQMAAQQQLANVRAGLPAGSQPAPTPGVPGQPQSEPPDARHGTYL